MVSASHVLLIALAAVIILPFLGLTLIALIAGIILLVRKKIEEQEN